MPTEYKYAGNNDIYHVRPPKRDFSGPLLERDVTEWRASKPESNVLLELRRLRAMSKDDLENTICVALSANGNPYEQDTAILFHLIQEHGIPKVQATVRELLGTPTAPKQGER